MFNHDNAFRAAGLFEGADCVLPLQADMITVKKGSWSV